MLHQLKLKNQLQAVYAWIVDVKVIAMLDFLWYIQILFLVKNGSTIQLNKILFM